MNIERVSGFKIFRKYRKANLVKEFINSNEAFATSTAGGIIPITKINGKNINNGKIGKVTSQLKNLYWEKHTDPQWSQSVDELI